MIQVYPAESRYSVDHGWLKSKFSFSFAEYFDPNNLQFGPMRVLNDDIVAPGTGFDFHPHREMEIVSIVLKGRLQHEDSLGNKAITTFGEVQRMSAGTGIFHSETNPSSTEEVNFLQLWFLPMERGIQPSYETSKYEISRMKNALLPVVSHKRLEGTAYIHQDLTIYLSELEENKGIRFEQDEGRRIFLFVLEGDLTLNGSSKLKKRDSARITETPRLDLRTESGAMFMLIDLPW